VLLVRLSAKFGLINTTEKIKHGNAEAVLEKVKKLQ
jgi:hypothetical protein